MAEVTESQPAAPVQPIGKERGRFARKRPAPVSGSCAAEAEDKAASRPAEQGNSAPLEHVDTYA